jgi:flagellar basal-body rod modification protein FlgD
MTAVDPFAPLRLGANTSTTNTQNTQNSQGASGAQFGTNTFLQLLVAQLRYQNPLNPQDGTQFLTQTAQFTEVEKLTDIDTQVTSALNANQLIAASTMIGHQVTYKDANGNDQTGAVTSVKVTSSGPQLQIGTDTVPFSMIEQVNQASTSSNSTTTPATT